MHELSVMESILNIALKHARKHEAHRILGIGLRVGEMSDLVDEWMQRYFDYLSRETIAAGALLKIERTPVIFECESCGTEFPVHMKEIRDATCPGCGGSKTRFKSGREFFIKNIEVI
jgi:hydrogenase nickel incorporation protein HypA/HybF